MTPALMKPYFKILAGSVIGTYLLITQVILPFVIDGQLRSALRSCKSCRLTQGYTSVSFFPPSVTFRKIQFKAGDPKTTGVEAAADRIQARIFLSRLLSGEIHLGRVHIDAPDVTITEGNGPPWHGPGEAPPLTPPELRAAIDAIEFNDGKFAYQRIRGPQPASLRVFKINGSTGPVGTTPALINELARAKASGQLEHTGSFELEVSSLIFSKTQHLDIQIHIEDQNLADVNPYFNVEHGVKLAGSVVKGESELSIRDQTLKAWVQIQYLGLDVQFRPSRENSPAMAFFSNLVKSIKLNPTSIGRTARQQTRGIEIKRLYSEFIMQFIVRGMRDAALKLSMS